MFSDLPFGERLVGVTVEEDVGEEADPSALGRSPPALP